MYTFLLMAVPCLLLFFLQTPAATRATRNSYWLAFCLGFFPAVAWCVIDEFFLFNALHFSRSLSEVYVHLLLKDILIPTILLCAPYFLISRRETENRAFALLVVLSAFYMAYMPYGVVTGKERFSFFLVFVKPLLTCCHIILLPVCCMGLCRSLKTGKKPLAAAFAVGMIVFPALPPLVEALWYLAYPRSTWLGIGAAMLAFAVILPIFLCEMGSKTLDKSI